MGAPKPTMGHPSITAAIMAMKEEGRTTSQIADRLGLKPQRVASLYCYAIRANKRRAKGEPVQLGRTVLFSTALMSRLAAPAAARGITANELARRIVDVAAKDGLIDSILDDLDQQET